MTGSDGVALNPGSGEDRSIVLGELPRQLAHIQTLWQKLLYVQWDAQSLELVRRLVHELRTMAAQRGIGAGAEQARKLEQELQMLQNRSGPPPETERGRLQGMLQRFAHALLDAHAAERPLDPEYPLALPAAADVAVQAPVHSEADQPRRIYLLSDSCRVDEPWIIRFDHAGYATHVCAHLAELRRAVQLARPHLIVAEVTLAAGGLSGIEAIDALQSEFGKETPVLFVGVRGDLTARLAAVRVGAAGYFLKPLDEQELFHRVEELLPNKPLNYRVLIVEDEEQLAGAYALVLQQAGFTVQVLNAPLRILDVLQQFQPDLVLMDLHLAECSGAELMQLIRQDPAYCALPILFLSGDTDPVQHNTVLSQGADLFLLKPIKPAQLIAAIGARIGRACALRQRLQWLSQRDALTGLNNRHALRARLDRRLFEWQERAGRSVTLLYLEADRFRALRDRLGMAAADLLLVDLAVWLTDRFAATEMAHLGDACFCALVDQDATEARDRAARLCEAAAEKLFDVGGESVSITLSIGIATPQMQFRSGEDWLGAAALACDIAHDGGGGRVELQRAAAVDVADHEQYAHYARLLRSGLQTDGFYCVYQPIMNLRGKPVERYDVLLRVRDSQARELNVERMFAVAKAEGLQAAVDRWVIEHILAVLRRRIAAGAATVFFIKLSADTLGDSETGQWIAQRIVEAQIDTRQLVFEFAETDVAAAVLSADRLLASLHGLGCGIALEHFGSLPGTARVLGRIPVDYVKIDATLLSRQEERHRIHALLERSSPTGVQVIAGFVEDAASLAALWQWGVQYIQGNFLQAPGAELDFDFRDEVVE